MKLMKVDIEGFRSIEKMTIRFGGSGHKVLVGKNESGKSNILKALSLLSNENEFTDKDKKEMYLKGIHKVLFFFKLGPRDMEQCDEQIFNKFVSHNQHAVNPIQSTEELTIGDFLAPKFAAILDVQPGKKTWKVSLVANSIDTSSKWYVTKETIANVPLSASSKETFSPGKYVRNEFILGLEVERQAAIRNHLTPIASREVFESLCPIIKKTLGLDNCKFPVAYWRYSEHEDAIPSVVDREQFSQNPASLKSLRNMFLLANIPLEKIQSKITNAHNKSHNALKSLLDDVNRNTNAYIENTWKEFRDVRIVLRSEGSDIAIGIEDAKNTFDFGQRSDGFRRFVSFLLLLSVAVEQYSDKSNAPLILIDEPETSLHPSGARDFRDKLIKLGKENVVVYSTHSPSMIDSINIERNLIVERNLENTTIAEAKEDGVSSAENVYNAIGHSIYADLKATNILLEGYTDKQTIRLFTDTDEWQNFGVCFTDGVKNINHVFSILDLASKRYFVLSDADQAALAKKKEMGNPAYWFTYKDLDCDAITIEDFYKPNFFLGVVKQVFKATQIQLDNGFNVPETNRIAEIYGLIPNNLPGGKSKKGIKNEIKVLCAKNVKKANVEAQKIAQMLTTLHQQITETQDT